MKRLIASLLCLLLLASSAAAMETVGETIPYWSASSPAMASIMDFVASVTDEASDSYLPPEKRIAVFDSDGTLYGELFPTYFDQCLLMHRLLHDDTYEGLPEDVAYCQALEDHLLRGGEKPKSSKSSAQMCAEAFRGFTVEEYQAYIRDFMKQPAWGFENLTYEDGFYKPMTALVQYLALLIYEKVCETLVCEHSARRTAMNNANDNANDMISKLSLSYNRARQAAITNEIIEIISGSEAQRR